jgi:endonuclease/exonuclease/phosphatase family metal-dependent hydrolase
MHAPLRRRRAGRLFRDASFVLVLVVVAAARSISPAQPAPASAFKVANWNVRSGMGIGGKKPQIDHNTTDCRLNASKPGGPFWPAMDVIKTDADVVALGVQEAWACATPEAILAYLGWRQATPERNGTGLVTRYGLRGKHVVEQVAFKDVEGASEDQWLFGGDVCIDADCRSTVRIYSAHFAARDDVGFTAQARNTVAYVKSQPSADRNIIVGDLNFFMANRTFVPCGTTRATSPPAEVFAAAEYVDAWLVLKPGIDGPTGMWNRRDCGHPEGGLFKRIDYIYSRGLTPTEVRLFATITPMVQDAPSDHAGIVATFGGQPKKK